MSKFKKLHYIPGPHPEAKKAHHYGFNHYKNQQLAQAIKNNGFSLLTLCDELDIHRYKVIDLLNGKMTEDMDLLWRLSEILMTTPWGLGITKNKQLRFKKDGVPFEIDTKQRKLK